MVDTSKGGAGDDGDGESNVGDGWSSSCDNEIKTTRLARCSNATSNVDTDVPFADLALSTDEGVVGDVRSTMLSLLFPVSGEKSAWSTGIPSNRRGTAALLAARGGVMSSITTAGSCTLDCCCCCFFFLPLSGIPSSSSIWSISPSSPLPLPRRWLLRSRRTADPVGACCCCCVERGRFFEAADDDVASTMSIFAALFRFLVFFAVCSHNSKKKQTNKLNSYLIGSDNIIVLKWNTIVAAFRTQAECCTHPAEKHGDLESGCHIIECETAQLHSQSLNTWRGSQPIPFHTDPRCDLPHNLSQ